MANLDENHIAPETLSGSAPIDDAAEGSEKPVNEIVKAAQLAKDGEKQAEKTDHDHRTTWIAAGVGVSIGSAALVAALLYANRDRGGPKKKG